MSERRAAKATWAKPVETLTAGEAPAGAPNLVEGKRLVGPRPGLREAVAEDLQGAARRRRDDAAGRDRRRGATNFAQLLAEGQRLLPVADRASSPGEVALIKLDRPGEAEVQDGRDGALLRRRVLHADDAGGPHVRRLDHVLGATRSRARRSRRPRCSCARRIRSARSASRWAGTARRTRSGRRRCENLAVEPRRRDPEVVNDDGLRRREASVVARDATSATRWRSARRCTCSGPGKGAPPPA